ncbi:MAG: hypothetical protein H6728_17750 [Myxococcales bacterium]|nr:hypothetical protein [Myxococcales bacterium]MCB9644920.1 hypothetical protein [Myxococcales bacterium]
MSKRKEARYDEFVCMVGSWVCLGTPTWLLSFLELLALKRIVSGDMLRWKGLLGRGCYAGCS